MTNVILGGIILAMFSGMLGLLLGNRKKVTIEEFMAHRDADNPHRACPVHEAQLERIEKKLDKVDEKIDRLIER